MKYVIIGNSAAAVGCVEGIRLLDKTGEIIIISSEPHHTYSRPLISYLLLGKTTEEKMRYRSESFYTDNNITFMPGETVTAIDSAKKQLTLKTGGSITFDKLCVCAGSSPFVPPAEGLDTVENCFTFMSLDDARALKAALGENRDKSVLIVGGGLIGLKCAEGILKRSKKLTVIDLAPRILSSILDDTGAKIIQNHLEEQGIEFKLGCSVKSYTANSATLDTGETLSFDILVMAVGVRPNTALLKNIADIDRGIIVNSKSETSAKDIYAAGDCTQTTDISCGTSRILAIMPNAYMQGESAGITMAGAAKLFNKAFPMNAIGFFRLHVATAGSYAGDSYEKIGDKSYKRLFYSDDTLNGFIIIGDIEKAGIYTNLIRERTPLSSIDFDLISESPGLMAFTKEVRHQKLGGAV